MIRTTLMLHGTELWPLLGKIVFIATPHYGSPSIAGYLKNHLWGWEQLAVLGAFMSRATVRSMWGVLSLLPAPAPIYPGTRIGQGHPCANFDLYSAGAYQLGLDAGATEQLQQILDAAAKFHSDLFNWHNSLSTSQLSRMLQISGVGQKTLFRLDINPQWLGLWKNIDKITSRIPGDPNREGDGRVPLASAELEQVELRYVKSNHGSAPNVPSVVKDTLSWIADQALSLPDSPQGALSSALSNETASSAPHLDASAIFNPADDEYDRYREFTEDELKDLVHKFESGAVPGVDFVRIL
jgi:hypothetical protein